ncbi:hypothetical protein tb265_30070 [Gemmatimonadetes bacterium T265]|nr:hypothetical protein tb265_30070 [Gemmatimonadetes bacterium T265]
MPRPTTRIVRRTFCRTFYRALPAAAFVLAAGVAHAQASAAQTPAAGAVPTTAPVRTSGPWRVRTAEHVDLWLHGIALVLDDTARVPLFARGYRAAMRAERTRANAYTELDANMERLRARVATNPQLALSAQFVPLAFNSFEELRRAVDAFVQAGGDARAVRDAQTANAVAFLAAAFPAAADRDWVRLYTTALQDERDRFYHKYWLALQQTRAAPLAAADSVWQGVVRPRIQRYLSGSQQGDGALLLSPVLGGEGRTQNGSKTENVVAVGLPARVADAADASYAAVHEMVGAVVGQVVADNTSPADQRSGVAGRYVGAGQVRGGLLLLRRAAPELADGYARFYLRGAGLAAPNVNPQAALEAAFPLPSAIVDALARQLDVVLGGI